MDNNFSQEQIDKIVDMYNNKISINVIMKELNSDEHCIREILKDKQLDRKPNRLSDELRSHIKELYLSGDNTNAMISYNTLVSNSNIDIALRRFGIEIPKAIKHYKDEHYFDIIDTPNKAYILGLLFSDGSNSMKKISISLQEEDKEILIKIADELKFDGDLYYVKYDNNNYKNQYRLTISSKYMCQQLSNLGMVKAKSTILHFPNNIDECLLSHFVRGLFDGDGSIWYNKARNSWCLDISGTYDICVGVGKVIETLGYRYCLKQDKRAVNCYQVEPTSIGGRNAFLQYIYKDAELKIDRKYNKYLLACEEYNMKIS